VGVVVRLGAALALLSFVSLIFGIDSEGALDLTRFLSVLFLQHLALIILLLWNQPANRHPELLLAIS
jgi:hypothetical protein